MLITHYMVGNECVSIVTLCNFNVTQHNYKKLISDQRNDDFGIDILAFDNDYSSLTFPVSTNISIVK